jgi:hypothetical protein
MIAGSAIASIPDAEVEAEFMGVAFAEFVLVVAADSCAAHEL